MSVTFYRDQLKSRQAKSFYDTILRSISRGNLGGIYLLTYKNRNAAIDDSFAAIKALRQDRPEFFFIGIKSTAILRNDQLVLMNQVPYTPEQIQKIQIRLDRFLETVTVGTAGLSDWEREKMIYRRIIRHLTYIDHSTDDKPKSYDHDIVGPLLQGSGVCEGFSCLLMLALRRAGIPCIRVSGFGRNEAHCWNIAWIDGTPAHLDITWDSVNDRGDVGFFYFNLTDEQITRDHKITTRGLPRCMDHTIGYHFHEGTVFDSPRDASKFLERAFLYNPNSCSIRFSPGNEICASVKKAMERAPVARYRFRYSDSQCTALVWPG